MKFESLPSLPEKNELPLNISESAPMTHQGRDANIWKVKTGNPEEEKALALKQVKKEEFATDEAMKKSREFYDFLKQNPLFGKFVPDTLYFKSRETAESQPHAYRLQKILQGKRIDEITDRELYDNEVIMQQLLDFIHAATEMFREAEKEKKNVPDLYGDKLLANYLFNPRHSSNIIVTEKPDQHGQRVFFVDTNPQSQQLKGIGKEFQRHIGDRLQLAQLDRWGKDIKKRLAEMREKPSLNGVPEIK